MRPGAEVTGAWRAALAELRLEFAGQWRPWLSDGGRFWATRLGLARRRPPGELQPQGTGRAWAMTLGGFARPEELRAAILEQESADSG